MKSEEKLICRENFLLTQDYLNHLLGKRKKPQTVRRYRTWLNHLLLWAMDTPFEKADRIRISYLEHVKNLNLAPESEKKIIETARAFLRWAKFRYERRFVALPYYWIEDLTPPAGQKARVSNYVHVDEVHKIINMKIDRSNLALWRDQAMACMLFLSGARADAAVSLPIKAVHLDESLPSIEQKTELGVRTKNGKSSTTYLHTISDLVGFVREWDGFVRANFPGDSPWYVPIHQQWGEQTTKILVPGSNRTHILRKRLRIIAELAGMPYKPPHKYRHGYAVYGLERCQTMTQYHSLSRNMLHESIATTDKIYVQFEEMERGRILSEIHRNPVRRPDSELEVFINRLGRQDLQKSIILSAQRLADL